MSGKVLGPNIVDRGVYQAVELAGQGLVSLKLIDVQTPPRDDVIKVQISKRLAGKIGRAKKPGETLAGALERLVLLGIRGPADPADFS